MYSVDFVPMSFQDQICWEMILFLVFASGNVTVSTQILRCREQYKTPCIKKNAGLLGLYLCAPSLLPELLGKVKNAGLTNGTCINLLKSVEYFRFYWYLNSSTEASIWVMSF